MTIWKLASKLAQLEGKKVEVSIGNVREILKCLAILGAEDKEVMICLIGNEDKQRTRNAKKKLKTK